MNVLKHLKADSNNELFIDPERLIAINARHMTPAQTYRYYKSFFLTMRPDLTDLEYQTFSKRFISGILL